MASYVKPYSSSGVPLYFSGIVIMFHVFFRATSHCQNAEKKGRYISQT